MASNKGGTHGGGFGNMDPQKQREISSMGGRAAHQSGHAHEFDSREAREAGRKGGEAVSQDRQHMSDIGRMGGEASHGSGHGRSTSARQGGGPGSGLQATGREEQREPAGTGGGSGRRGGNRDR